MTGPGLFGPTTSVALQQLNMTAKELSFNAALDPVLGTIGEHGCPDPAKDPMAAYRYLDGMREIIKQAANQKPLIRLADKDLNVLTEITGEMSGTAEELMADSGQATVVIRYDHWIEDYVINGVTITEDLHLLIDPIPTQQDWRIRWGGKVKEISLVNNEDGTATITFLALSHREHMKHFLFGAAPWVGAPQGNLRGTDPGTETVPTRISAAPHVDPPRPTTLGVLHYRDDQPRPHLFSRLEHHHQHFESRRVAVLP